MAYRPLRVFLRLLLLLLVSIAVFGAFWFGLVPNSLSPFPRLSLDTRPGLFVDARLSALRFDPELCHAVLTEPQITASPIPDRSIENGCGWENAVRVSNVGGAQLSVGQITCEMAAAVALWVEHEVQPLARETFGQEVARINNMGTYGCRNIVGNPMWKGVRSQHATANALDIGGFTLTDGRTISLIRDWTGKGKDSQFLREVHRRSCRYFRVSLGPEFNVAHKDHFHFDRGIMWTCR